MAIILSLQLIEREKKGISMRLLLATTLCFFSMADADLLIVNDAQVHGQLSQNNGILFSDWSLLDGFNPIDVYTNEDELFGWSLTANNGVQGLDGIGATSLEAGEALTISFLGEDVCSVGAMFGLNDESGEAVSGTLQLTLDDGSSFFTTIQQDGGFGGFISLNQTIQSLTFQPFGESDHNAIVSSIRVGVVPSPGVACVLLIGLHARRSRLS